MTDKITEFLAESKRLEEAATPGPWWTGMEDGFSYTVEGPLADSHPVAQRLIRPDAEFIAHSREDVPRMRRALEAVRHELREAERLAMQGPGMSGHEIVWAVRRAIESALTEEEENV